MPAISAKKRGKSKPQPISITVAEARSRCEGMELVEFKLGRSAAHAKPTVRATAESMGLRRMGLVKALPNNDVTWGQAAKIWPYIDHKAGAWNKSKD